ncbi:hypothetical protein V5P93_002041 [Actinokineospora auranticolor]|uniref:Histidine decarboxylase n=1 Tax=Actinokineospora auranticolor TaxID=155976 RepID=A0A2S6GCJ0_9PSEU|nr:histidine decarboxylase [Actinokineospora auranticolor]PPK62569.1 histidine decarboxylase [Actinokineospora auranticolor]
MTQVDSRPSALRGDVFTDDIAIPSQEVWSTYPPTPPTPDQLKLKRTGLTPAERAAALDRLAAYVEYKRDHLLGYQINSDMNGYAEDLSRFLRTHINNIGDPFQDGGLKVNSKVVEQAVLDYFAELWHGKPYVQADKESCWGYSLSMGSTEGNMYALWNARDYLSGRRLLGEEESDQAGALTYASPQDATADNRAYQPVVFYSEDTHYSFNKAVRVLSLPTFGELGRDLYKNECPINNGVWPDEVPSALPETSNPDERYSTFGPGSIDVDKLVVLVDFFARKGHPIIVSLNFGSTFKGAYDPVREVSDRLLPIFHANGLIDREIHYGHGRRTDHRRGFWIHVDGALGAGYVPFLAKAAKEAKYGYNPDAPVPEFDFGLRSRHVPEHGEPVELDMVASIVVSGHKWMGAPVPCGIFATKVKYQMQPPSKPDYIGSLDTTFAGSRNGFSPIVIWDHIAKNPDDRQITQATHAQRMSAYLVDRLVQVEQYRKAKFNEDSLFIDRTPLAITVRFRRPGARLVAKWSLSTVSLRMRPNDDSSIRHIAHVFLMPSTTQEQIDAFTADLYAYDAFDPIEPQSALSRATAVLAETPFVDRGFA